jgi:hypothetical protein
LETITSHAIVSSSLPHSSLRDEWGTPVKRSDKRKWMRWVRWWWAALAAATVRAAGEMSVAVMWAWGRWWARAMAMAPEPVPMSRIWRGAVGSGWVSFSSERTASTRSSVSGRGMRTAGATWSARPKNSCSPVMYWMGSWVRRRAMKAS